uniref:Uncharacterized protein n=1 Tax=Sinocyclocheilus rhinocerous TaxID=307959 RepID=A0A673JNN7_9TELE
HTFQFSEAHCFPLEADMGSTTESEHDAILKAISSGDLYLLQELLKGLDVNTALSSTDTLLHLAAEHGKEPALMALLLRVGAQINSVTQDGLTPLHLASQSGHTEAVAQLLEGKADIHVKDKQGRTALHCAAAQGEVSVIQLLLAAGSDANATEKEKKTPLHLAAMEGHTKKVLRPSWEHMKKECNSFGWRVGKLVRDMRLEEVGYAPIIPLSPVPMCVMPQPKVDLSLLERRQKEMGLRNRGI